MTAWAWQDESAMAALRAELLDAVRQRMQCGSNKAQLPASQAGDDEEDVEIDLDDDAHLLVSGRSARA